MSLRRMSVVAFLALAASAMACKGDKGVAGADGATGPAGSAGTPGAGGAPGAPGVSVGTITGTLTYKPAATALPASGVSVNVIPDVGLTAAVSAADGTYTLGNVPIGVYTVAFSGNAFASAQTSGVVVAATKTVVVDKLLVANNPLVLTVPSATAPARFGSAGVQLNVTVTGGTPPYTYAWTAKATNPTAVTLSNAAIANPTFTMDTLANVLASGKVAGLANYVGALSRTVPGFVPVSVQALAQMTYNFDCKVTDAQGFTKTVTQAVPPATLAQGNFVVPVNQIVILNVPGNSSALTLDVSGAPGSAATLQEASGVNPWFIPDVVGAYSVTAGTATLAVNAGKFVSSNPTCGLCHGATPAANLAAKFKSWNNSAHGNHFFKFMEYDAGGNLVWKKDASGNPLPAPTADPTIFWNQPGAMTTFQFGMTGAEGSHYGKNCVACHTTGYNLLAGNDGFDDVAAAAGWVFPDLKSVFGGDATTPAPVLTAWNAIPANVKGYAGMQCESCHGPLGRHKDGSASTSVKPLPVYDVAACAVCHDRPSNHDRVYLWKQSKHAEVLLAEEESVVESRGTNTSCYRCHGAQGFVQYLKNKDADPSKIVRPAGLTPAPATCTPATYPPTGDVDPACPCTPTLPATTCTGDPAFYAYLKGLGLDRADVQPVTCAACHDAHATDIRIDGNTGPLPNGWQMNGAGAGALCIVCHNTRNGARGDFVTVSSVGGPHAPVQGDLLMGVNAYFMGAGGIVSKHAAVAETCVGCHMLLHPDSVRVTNTNHTFAVDETICKACHSAGVDLAGLKGQFLLNRDNLQKAFTSAVLAVPAIGGASPSYYLLNSQTVGGVTTYASVARTVAPTSVTVSGDRSANVTFNYAASFDNGFGTQVTSLTVPFRRVSADGVLNATGDGYQTPIFLATGIIAKTNWNVGLVSSVAPGDAAANVIHNPSFVFNVLSATTGQLLTAAGAAGAGL